MICKSTVKRLAKQCGIDVTEIEFLRREATEGYFISVEDLQIFAQAIIENYKVGLVLVGEVGYLGEAKLVGYLRSDIEIPYGTKLYTLPSGETK